MPKDGRQRLFLYLNTQEALDHVALGFGARRQLCLVGQIIEILILM
jgi:hypothetical protein